MQDQVAAKNVELGRVPSEDNEADVGTKYLERNHRIKKCVTKMEMLFAGAWAGEQLLVVSGTEVIIGEDLVGRLSWTIGVILFVTARVVLLSCACVVCYPHLPTGNATGEPEVAKQLMCMSPRSMQADDTDHVKERTWILSGYSGDQLWQLMMWNTRSFCGKLVQFLRHIATVSEDQQVYLQFSRSL